MYQGAIQLRKYPLKGDAIQYLYKLTAITIPCAEEYG